MGKFVTRNTPISIEANAHDEQKTTAGVQMLGILLISGCVLGAIAILMLAIR